MTKINRQPDLCLSGPSERLSILTWTISFGLQHNYTMQGRNFEISIVSTVKTTKNLNGEYFEEWLNQNFRLFKYGDELDEIFILFNVDGPESSSYYQYHPEDHFLELTVVLPEKELHDAGKKETLLLMASALLSTLQSVSKQTFNSFDISSFRADLAELLA